MSRIRLLAMNKLAELIDLARTLSCDDRRRLMGELDALEREEAPPPGSALAALLAASGTVHSEFSDVSTNKYAHVAPRATVSVEPFMRRVFVDTGGFVALLVAEDRCTAAYSAPRERRVRRDLSG